MTAVTFTVNPLTYYVCDRPGDQSGRYVRADVAERSLAACQALDDMDFCEGYTFPDGDWPKLWKALGLARAALRHAAEAAP